MEIYEHKCAITEHGPDDVLEAAHIEPHSTSGINSTENGLLLRADIHALMDVGLIVISPDSLKVMIHVDLMNTPYEQYMNKRLTKPVAGGGPGIQYLRDRFESVVAGSRMKFLPLPISESAK